MENYENLEKFTQRMSIDILNKLNGSHSEFKRIELPDNPSKIIVLGTLGDRSTDHSEDKNEDFIHHKSKSLYNFHHVNSSLLLQRNHLMK